LHSAEAWHVKSSLEGGEPVAREIDESWIEEAIGRYQQLERQVAEFEKALATVEVTVRSPDGLVEVLVTADGSIRDVIIGDGAAAKAPRELARSVQAAVTAAADAAGWARTRLHQDMFGGLTPLPGQRGER
jgi:DNA-binding protein YbaB